MSEEERSERKDSITALDYINDQLQLEREAKEIMPYDPNECTYEKGDIRQPVFACLTCYKENDREPIGVCYSCSIQCHSTHEIVELFAKRNFVCDCGTTRMSKTPGGACKLRQRIESRNDTDSTRFRTGSTDTSHQRSKHTMSCADDIPSLTNTYNQNYRGLFCSCSRQYNPLEETGNMIQCHFGYMCGEDWFHEDCILGYKHGVFDNRVKGENILDKLPDVSNETPTDKSLSPKEEKATSDENAVPNFPDLNDFDSFICWKCVQPFKHIFELLDEYDIIFMKKPHFDELDGLEAWNRLNEDFLKDTTIKQEHSEKRVKLDKKNQQTAPFSVFLKNGFKDSLKQLTKDLPQDSKLGLFLNHHPYLYEDDPVYEPPADIEDEDSSHTGSLLDLGAEALHSLPKEQAIDGIQAYEKVRSKLRDFFKPFAEQGKVVTEDEVRSFFDYMKKDT